MTGYVLALSGAIGAGKSTLSANLAEALGADMVSFGREVRRYAEEGEQGSSKDRAILQQLGQALVLSDLKGFVTRVLRQEPRQLEADSRRLPLVVEGIRHVEVLMELRRQIEGRHVHLLHIVTPSNLREQRLMERDKVERRVIARYDNDITEAQVARILPQYAACFVEGDLPERLQIAQVLRKIDEWTVRSSNAA